MVSLGPNELSVHVLTMESKPSQVNKHIDQNWLSMISYELITSYLNADLFSICLKVSPIEKQLVFTSCYKLFIEPYTLVNVVRECQPSFV